MIISTRDRNLAPNHPIEESRDRRQPIIARARAPAKTTVNQLISSYIIVL